MHLPLVVPRYAFVLDCFAYFLGRAEPREVVQQDNQSL